MVLTRSRQAGCSTPKPPTLVRKRKKRSKSVGDNSSDDECIIELNDIKKSLALNLEAISEEIEEVSINENDEKFTLKNIKMGKRQQSKTLNMESPTKVLDTIAEECIVEATDNKIIPENTPGQSSSNTSISNEDSGSNLDKQKKHRFYFPPAKTLVPLHLKPASIDVGMKTQETYIDVKCAKNGKKKIENLYKEVTINKKDSQLIDSVITPDFETKLAIPAEKSINQLRKEKKELREASAGKEWFSMKPPEMTNDVKRDLKILQMRSVLDPKRFYKHNDRKALPRYFQIGKIMDNAADFYSSRVPKKQRKPNLTEELLADAVFQKYQKRKYNEIQMKRKAEGEKQRRVKRGKFSKRRKEIA